MIMGFSILIFMLLLSCVCTISTVGPPLSESPLSEPLVIQTLFQILKSFDFHHNQVINGMSV